MGSTKVVAWLALTTIFWAGPILAQSPLADLPTSALSRLQEAAELSQRFAEAPAAAIRVIVEFAPPALPDGVFSGTERGDAAQIAGVAAVQDRILGRVLGGPDGVQSAQANAALSLRRLTFSPMFALNADAALIAALAADPEVVRIVIDRPEPPALTASLPVIGMPTAYAAGATGNGQTVAVLDSGARFTHEFLSSRITQGACFNSNVPSQGASSRCPGGVTQAFTIASGDDCTASNIFGCGHGTHVAGTAAGFNTSQQPGEPAHGVARDGRLMAINVFSLFPGSECGSLPGGFDSCILSYPSDQIAALEHVFSLRNSTTFAAVNMSLGGGNFSSACTSDQRRPIIQQLTNAGIAVVISAGNNGRDTQVGAPGCIPEAITVGSTTTGDIRSSFSNWGSLVDIAAPGSAIVASYIDGSSDAGYASLSGTSVAAPHVAGAFAAIRSVRPTATVAEILTALRDTGTSIISAGTTIPRINVATALNALGGGGNVATTTTLIAPASANQGASVTLTATVIATGGTPTGTVSFRNGGTEFGTGTLSGGTAQLTTTSLPVGTLTLTAQYLGTAGFSPSTSAPRSITINAPPAPPNDNFANRITIAAPGTVNGSNVGATRETLDPDIAGGSRLNSVWWTFTPTGSGSATIDTCGSNFDTVLGVFTGAALGALTPQASNDDFCGLGSSVTFNVTAGTAYQIAVAGWNGLSGSIVLNAAFPVAAVSQPTTTLLSGPTSGQSGQTLTYTATVSSTGGTPTGTVSFRSNGVEFATGSLNGQGVATGGGSFQAGTHPITAHYLGATGFLPSQSAAQTLVVTQAPSGVLEFVGGGTVFEFTAACAAGGWASTPHAARLRYGPGEVNGMPSQVGVLFPSGSEHLQTWHALAQSTLNYDALGRQMWTFFVLQQPFPRTTPVQRRITVPANGTDIATATEVMMRLRVSNFGGIVGCGATVAGVLRRAN